MARSLVGDYFKILMNYLRFALEYTRVHRLPAITASEVHARLGQPDFFVFDCNLESL